MTPWLPRSGRRSPCRARSLDLSQRHAPPHEVLDAVPHDREHVPVFDHIGFVRQTAVTRNHVRPPSALSFGTVMSSRRFSASITLRTPTVLYVDDRIGPR